MFNFLSCSIGQTDILTRSVVVLRSHGQTRPKISSIYSSTTGMAYFGRRNRNERHQNIFDFCYDVVDDW